MIVDGKKIAHEVISATRVRAKALDHVPILRAITVAPNAATESYLRMKTRQAIEAGIVLQAEQLPDHAATEEVIAAIKAPGADAVMVQLPLPTTIDTHAVLDSIPIEKDADVLAMQTRTQGMLIHPVAAAVEEILKRHEVNVQGMKTAVVGNGWLVGAPVAAWLQASGAEVTILTRESGELRNALKNADLIVSGAGVAGLIKHEDIKQDAIVIDVGTSELGGSIAGDVDPAVAQKASIFTPVPGGVGPIAVAKLFENAVILAEHKLSF